MNVLKFFFLIPRIIAAMLVRMYQIALSPDHSFWAKQVFPDGYCKFYPSCSEYGKQVIEKRGIVVGGVKTIWRILRCNPWNDGGIDLPR